MSQLTVTLKTMTDNKTSKEENSCAQEEWDNIYFKSSHGQQHSISLPMGVPSIEAEEAAASSLSESDICTYSFVTRPPPTLRY